MNWPKKNFIRIERYKMSITSHFIARGRQQSTTRFSARTYSVLLIEQV